ncbi:MAG: type II toxin-antitoxin system RelE/ParE family toxin [Myxococcales bacterium]|nr:type II toxin-antitoxin system RelE/ParE family toxin [Myxococcales bacterium]
MSKAVRTSPVADAQAEALDRWWRENREKSPDLFTEELTRALQTISAAPGAGKTWHHPGARVRRLLMRATHTHVYYVERDNHVLVVALWGAVKGAGPDLRGL